MIVEKALKTCADMTEYFGKELLFAGVIEQALVAGGFTEWPEDAGFSASPSTFCVSLYGELQKDIAFRTMLRRALGVPVMKRTFDRNGGLFQFTGDSRTLLFDGHPITLTIRAGSNGCTLKAVKETVEVTRWQADCTGVAEVEDTDA